MKSVYCIVITYNGIKWVDKCFDSLNSTDYPIKTIVVDNGSSDGTQGTIAKNYPDVDLIQSDTNLGFGKANNIGIKKALNEGADYIFLLNQDAYLFEGSFKGMIEAFEKEPSAGIISPVHLAGDEQNLDYGFNRYVKPENTPGLLEDIIKGKVKLLYNSKFVNAAAWLIKSDVIKAIGMFHPIFDHYVEDNEYVHRLTSKGLGLFVYPHFKIVHDRPQGSRSRDKSTKRSMMYKQRVLFNYCTGKLSKSQVDVTYLKIVLYNLAILNLKYSSLSLQNWLDIRKKIKNFDSYHFDAVTTKSGVAAKEEVF